MFVWGFYHLLVSSVPTELQSGLFLPSRNLPPPRPLLSWSLPTRPPRRDGWEWQSRSEPRHANATCHVACFPHTPNLCAHKGPHASTHKEHAQSAPMMGLSRPHPSLFLLPRTFWNPLPISEREQAWVCLAEAMQNISLWDPGHSPSPRLCLHPYILHSLRQAGHPQDNLQRPRDKKSSHCKQGKTEAVRPSDKGGVERGSSGIPIGAKLLDGCI